MDGGARRKTGAGRLRDPPGLAHPRVVASHHVIANIIHEQGANLRRNVNRPGVRKRPLKRICFHSISPGNGPPRRPGVKHRGTVAGRYQAIPNLALPRRLIGIGRNGFYWRTDERLNRGRSQFRAAHGGVCRLRNVHLCRWRFWQHGPRVPRLRAHRSSLTACRGRRCLGVAKTIGCQCATEKRERCDKQCSPQGLWGARRATGNCCHSTVLGDRLSLVLWSWSALVPSEGRLQTVPEARQWRSTQSEQKSCYNHAGCSSSFGSGRYARL